LARPDQRDDPAARQRALDPALECGAFDPHKGIIP
jgi:hypothetical protein